MCLPLVRGSGEGTDANFSRTYFWPRLPPPRSPGSPTGSCSAPTWNRRARIPHTSAAEKCAARGSGGKCARGRSPGGRGPAAARGGELSGSRLRQPGDAAPGSSAAGSSLSELQFQRPPGLQHPLCPSPATTFNSPGGLRCSPAGRRRDGGCREEGGARERRRPPCASSFPGAERAALSSRLSSGLQS